ncbi:MAG: pirin-like C-terminal cupin domain-containing protein, partial [Candidatus Thorarchaeota archaeon]|nr:pirin-like C-terminal cupin domain-containing protein [Candidatus Thorarchaeota archaeon]
IVTDPEYLDVTLEESGEFKHSAKEGYTAFGYVFEGDGHFASNQEINASKGTLVLYDDGVYIEIKAGNEGVRFLLISGKPLNEPIAWRGPIVMNTDQELRTAFDEYQRGTFLKTGND